MRATDWEFKNRGMLMGLMFSVSFPLYSLDHQNVTAAIAARLAPLLHANDDHLVRILFVLAAILVSIAALIRTWASAYLRSEVVYAANVKTAALVADGPYRRVRNPLYLGNVLMGIGMASASSRFNRSASPTPKSPTSPPLTPLLERRPTSPRPSRQPTPPISGPCLASGRH